MNKCKQGDDWIICTCGKHETKDSHIHEMYKIICSELKVERTDSE